VVGTHLCVFCAHLCMELITGSVVISMFCCSVVVSSAIAPVVCGVCVWMLLFVSSYYHCCYCAWSVRAHHVSLRMRCGSWRDRSCVCPCMYCCTCVSLLCTISTTTAVRRVCVCGVYGSLLYLFCCCFDLWRFDLSFSPLLLLCVECAMPVAKVLPHSFCTANHINKGI